MAIVPPKVEGEESWTRNWSTKNPKVRAYVKFATAQRARGKIPIAATMVEWDRTHGKTLLPWDDAEAAAEHRLHLARLFRPGQLLSAHRESLHGGMTLSRSSYPTTFLCSSSSSPRAT
jgi:hypothetical protein